MKIALGSLLLILIISWLFGSLLQALSPVRGADRPIPKLRPAPEQCVGPDVKPTPGQTLQADTTCPGGYRWKAQK